MMCAWNDLINIVPMRFRHAVDKHGREDLQELRLRINMPPLLVTGHGEILLEEVVSITDIRFVVNMASRYSPWAAVSAAQGYITAPGGHRVGICGEVIYDGNVVSGVRSPTSLCIRVARDFSGIARAVGDFRGNLLIVGPPGSGKTTFLRDLIRQRRNSSVAVVDERGELFPMVGNGFCFSTGENTDVLSGCPKAQGIDNVLRTMAPAWIAVDEITAEQDCDALIRAGWCGVMLMATAHASDIRDLRSRPIYRSLIESGLFETSIVMKRDKSWRREQITI